MRVIVYKTRHGTTKQAARMINDYIGDCLLMDFDQMQMDILKQADVIVLGCPVYNGKLSEDVRDFILKHQELLSAKNYCLYIMAIRYSEFMKYVMNAFDYDVLKKMKVISGFGGIIHYSDLSLNEKMTLRYMNLAKSDKEKYDNLNIKEIEAFSKKIERLDQSAKKRT